jgi:hypothetical protein
MFYGEIPEAFLVALFDRLHKAQARKNLVREQIVQSFYVNAHLVFDSPEIDV